MYVCMKGLGSQRISVVIDYADKISVKAPLM